MDLDLSRYYERYYNLIHIILGGVICLLAMYTSTSILPRLVRVILYSLGCYGLMSFQEITNAMLLLMFGAAYLPSGFIGGLYTGHRIKENLRIILLFPALIGFAGMIALHSSIEGVNISNLDLQREIIIPLIGDIIGTYLGGYTMNWEEESEPLEIIEEDMYMPER